MPRFLCSLFLFLVFPLTAQATVELALQGTEPVAIADVYLQEKVPFLALDDVLPALGLSGSWDSVAHIYRIETPRGPAIISPGSQYLRLGGRMIAIEHQPRFIDGRLRISEDFLLANLAPLLGHPIYYRNLNPVTSESSSGESAIDRLFDFILQKKDEPDAPALRGVAIDPGHGGQDTGALGDGVKEKSVTLETARNLEKQLKMHLGIPVFMTRDGDYAATAEQRHEAAAQPDADIFLLLHAQSSFSPAARGVMLYIRPQEKAAADPATVDHGSILLARSLAKALGDAGLPVRGIVRAPLLPLGRGNLPTVLIELGYLSNPDERRELTSAEGQVRLAQALFAGVRAFADSQKEATP